MHYWAWYIPIVDISWNKALWISVEKLCFIFFQWFPSFFSVKWMYCTHTVVLREFWKLFLSGLGACIWGATVPLPSVKLSSVFDLKFFTFSTSQYHVKWKKHWEVRSCILKLPCVITVSRATRFTAVSKIREIFKEEALSSTVEVKYSTLIGRY